MTSRFWQSFPGVLIVALLWSGCAGPDFSERASINLVNVRPVATTVFETSVELTLRVTNESSRPLRLGGSSHRLFLNGTRVGQGVAPQEVVVPPLDSTTIAVVVHLENLQLLRKFANVERLEEVNYRLESRLLGLGGSVGLRTTTEGTFDLRPFTQGLRY